MNKILTLIIVIIFLSCSSDNTIIEDENMLVFEPVNVEFSTIIQDYLSGYGIEGIQESNLVIDNENDWDSLLLQINSYNDMSEFFTTTDIDFNESIVIAVFLGVKPSLWGVEIISMVEYNDEIIVTTSEFGTLLSAISQPFHIVEIPKTNKLIVFE